MIFGMAIAIVGVALLLRTMGIIPFSFNLSWPFILIIIGILTGIKHNFRNNAWWILILIGGLNLTPQFMIMGQPSRNFVWPALILLIGLSIAFRPRRRDKCYPIGNFNASISTDSTLNIDATFGGRKEVVTAKDFKGGIVSLTFGGCELNLTQADFVEQSVVLECKVSFGGLEIIVPSHWEVQNEINPAFGNVEDARSIQTGTTGENKKTLILRGTCSFGSIELKSY